MMRKTQIAIVAGTSALLFANVVLADVTGFTSFDEWTAAVGDYTTIDFTGHEQFTVITDQYSDLGAHFTDGNDFISNTGSYPNDGSGLHGSWLDEQITIDFDFQTTWIGFFHPGPASIELFANDEPLGAFQHVVAGSGNFTGVVSSVPFDQVRISREPFDTPPRIDDLFFGIPTPGAIAVLALAGMLCPGRRRSRT